MERDGMGRNEMMTMTDLWKESSVCGFEKITPKSRSKKAPPNELRREYFKYLTLNGREIPI